MALRSKEKLGVCAGAKPLTYMTVGRVCTDSLHHLTPDGYTDDDNSTGVHIEPVDAQEHVCISL